MKKITALALAIITICMVLASCNGDNGDGTSTSESTTTSTTVADTTTTTSDTTTTESTTTLESTTTDATTQGTTTTADSTTTSASNDDSWKEKLEYNENGILKSYIGAIDTTTFDANPKNVYKFTANEILKYDATVVIYFTESCGFCKQMIVNYLSPLYEAKKNVLVIGILQSPRLNSGAVQSIGQFKASYKVNFPTVITGYYGDNGVDSSAITALGTSVPQTYVLNREGKLVASYSGWAQEVGSRINGDIARLEAQYGNK